MRWGRLREYEYSITGCNTVWELHGLVHPIWSQLHGSLMYAWQQLTARHKLAAIPPCKFARPWRMRDCRILAWAWSVWAQKDLIRSTQIGWSSMFIQVYPLSSVQLSVTDIEIIDLPRFSSTTPCWILLPTRLSSLFLLVLSYGIPCSRTTALAPRPAFSASRAESCIRSSKDAAVGKPT